MPCIQTLSAYWARGLCLTPGDFVIYWVGKAATYYGIGAAAAKIVNCILQDARAVMTISGPSEYGVSLSLPRLIGKTGIFHIFMPEFSEAEKEKLDHGAKILGETQAAIIHDGELVG
ncbi:hypothetical protein [uncultured Desulfobacter sp.]|uniref:hypothetical protein n=1 Tax=uncultured Desulfobacter sp. TaxID=240139 RepID=UPI0029F58197|nr:hypothetical protein [uncultured Desulfobacter sp.]